MKGGVTESRSDIEILIPQMAVTELSFFQHYPPLLSQAASRRAGSKEEHLGLEPVPIWDAGSRGRNLASPCMAVC